MRRTVQRAISGTLAIGLLTLSIGCSIQPPTKGEARVYPEDLEQLETLNVQVFRKTAHIELTNTSSRVFGPSTLWLNGQFSRDLDGLDVGQSVRLPLASFQNEFGERFRAGGFFAIEAPYNLVLAQIETNTEYGHELIGLIVVQGREESL